MGNCIDADTRELKNVITELQEKIKRLEDRWTPPFTSDPSAAYSCDGVQNDRYLTIDPFMKFSNQQPRDSTYNVDNVQLKSSYVLQIEISSSETGEKITLNQTLNYEMTDISLKQINKKILMKTLTFVGDNKTSTKSYITLYSTGETVNFYNCIAELSKIFSSETPGGVKLSPYHGSIVTNARDSSGQHVKLHANNVNDSLRESNHLFHVQMEESFSTGQQD